jgi:4-amino-4-deoxy-L-arabinose transferase-like glycosyltransferase
MRSLSDILKTLPPTGLALAGFLAFYVLAGLFGHDPWKTEDVIHLTVARDFLDFPHDPALSLAGQPFLAAPLYYWSAALTGTLLGWLMPLHDALRLSNGLWMALALIAAYYAGREFYGQESAAAPPLLLAGASGLIVQAHEAQPMLVLLAALGGVLLAFGLLPRKPRIAALLLGIALLAAGLGTGLAGLMLLFILTLFFILLRGRDLRPALPLLGLSFLAPLLCLAATIMLLAHAAPLWLQGWLEKEVGAFFSAPRYFSRQWNILGMLPWFSWPLVPLAGWSLWLRRRQWRQPEILLPLSSFLLVGLMLPLMFAAGETPAMLLLPPLALLATPGVLSLRRGAANAFDWFSGMAFSAFALLLWTGWVAMVFGWPGRLARRAVELAPGFEGHFDFFPFILALAVSLWWGWSLIFLPRSPYRCLVRWTAGLTTVWLLAVSLWMPWIDYGKSYRGVAAALALQTWENKEACIAEWRLGSAQRASFAYFERLRFVPLRADGADEQTRCAWLLTQGSPRVEPTPPGEGWQRVWEGQRPGDRKERFRLYRRAGSD